MKDSTSLRVALAVVMLLIGLYIVLEGAVMPGAVSIGIVMVAFAAIVLVAILWKAATS